MSRTLYAAGAALVAGTLFCAAAPGGEPVPELPAVEWTGTPLHLEDFKGQLTVLIFYNDSGC